MNWLLLTFHRALRHRNCVLMYGLYQEAEKVYVVMELLSLGSLDKFLEENEEKIDVKDLQMMCVHIARGMAYLHSVDLLHNDLAARNVLLTLNDSADDGKYLVKVSDFGLSKFSSASSTLGNQEFPGLFMVCFA
jgi:serine/threonine protein kinase